MIRIGARIKSKCHHLPDIVPGMCGTVQARYNSVSGSYITVSWDNPSIVDSGWWDKAHTNTYKHVGSLEEIEFDNGDNGDNDRVAEYYKVLTEELDAIRTTESTVV